MREAGCRCATLGTRPEPGWHPTSRDFVPFAYDGPFRDAVKLGTAPTASNLLPALRWPYSCRRPVAGVATLAAALALFFFAVLARADPAGCPAESALEPGARLAVLGTGANHTLEVLAIGSSSTAGVGATSFANAYPARLEDELAEGYGIAVDVRNAGVGGELAAKTLQRLKVALKNGWAKLVIWQVGTNDALVGVDETLFRTTVESGVEAARAAHVPLMLIDPQFMLKAPDEARYERFVKIVDDVGVRDHVPVLARYAMMKRRGTKEVQSLLSRDGLHMNDLGYRCLAHAIAQEIEKSAGAASVAPLARGPAALAPTTFREAGSAPSESPR
jgi:acyl-CoA thioesterase I